MFLFIPFAFAATPQAEVPPCVTTYTTPDLLGAAELAEARFVRLDAEGFTAARGALEMRLTCTTDTLDGSTMGRIHRVEALGAFIDGRTDRVTQALAGLISADPGHQLPTALVPEGHPIRATLSPATALLKDDPGATMPKMASGWIEVDGTARPAAPTQRAAVMQQIDDQGAVVASHYRWPDEQGFTWSRTPDSASVAAKPPTPTASPTTAPTSPPPTPAARAPAAAAPPGVQSSGPGRVEVGAGFRNDNRDNSGSRGGGNIFVRIPVQSVALEAGIYVAGPAQVSGLTQTLVAIGSDGSSEYQAPVTSDAAGLRIAADWGFGPRPHFKGITGGLHLIGGLEVRYTDKNYAYAADDGSVLLSANPTHGVLFGPALGSGLDAWFGRRIGVRFTFVERITLEKEPDYGNVEMSGDPELGMTLVTSPAVSLDLMVAL